MNLRDERIDAYIEKSKDFAKPVLNYLRELVHRACPDVEETVKWGFPHFDYEGMMCSMASFKAHCTFNFWKGELLKDPHRVMTRTGAKAMGQFGRITAVSDLPATEILVELIREAVRLNDEGISLSKSRDGTKKELIIPDYFLAAVGKSSRARQVFKDFNHSNKKEYVEWVTGAKTLATRNNRLSTAVEWMAEGKVRNWKYIK